MRDYDRAAQNTPRQTWVLRLRRIALAPVTLALLVYFLIEDLFFGLLRPAFRLLGRLAAVVAIDRWLKSLHPYVALLVFSVPFVLIEPVKIFSLFWISIGHLVSGTVLLVVSYVVSLFVVERLFHAMRDQLLTIGWFAWGYDVVMRLRDWAYARLRSSWVWRHVEPLGSRITASLHAGLTALWRRTMRIFEAGRNLFRSPADTD